MQAIQADIFTNLTAINQLFIDTNKLTAIPFDIFSGLTALTGLWLHLLLRLIIPNSNLHLAHCSIIFSMSYLLDYFLAWLLYPQCMKFKVSKVDSIPWISCLISRSDIDHNFISVIPSGTFADTPLLTTLYFNYYYDSKTEHSPGCLIKIHQWHFHLIFLSLRRFSHNCKIIVCSYQKDSHQNIYFNSV